MSFRNSQVGAERHDTNDARSQRGDTREAGSIFCFFAPNAANLQPSTATANKAKPKQHRQTQNTSSRRRPVHFLCIIFFYSSSLLGSPSFHLFAMSMDANCPADLSERQGNFQCVPLAHSSFLPLPCSPHSTNLPRSRWHGDAALQRWKGD